MDAHRLVTATEARLDELFESYAIVGFVAGTGQAIKLVKAPTDKDEIAVRAMALSCGMEAPTNGDS